MTRKLMTVVIIVIAVFFCAFQSAGAQVATSNKGIQLKPGMIFTDPGNNAFITIVGMDTSSNVMDLGIRIDGGNECMVKCMLPEFQKFCDATKLTPTKTAPLQKVSKPKYLYRPVSAGQTWNSTQADAGIRIVSQSGDTLVVGIRIDGGAFGPLVAKTTTKALNAMLSSSRNPFRLVGQ